MIGSIRVGGQGFLATPKRLNGTNHLLIGYPLVNIPKTLEHHKLFNG
jgi:hypothetical protein